MSDFFSKDSRTSRWVKLIFLLSLTTTAIGTFFGGAYFFCGEDIWKPGVCAVLLALVVFLTIPKCSQELEKWGRHQSKAVIWAMFALGLLGSGAMVVASLFAWQGQIRWDELSMEYGEKINLGNELMEEYKAIKKDYFVLLEEKMKTGYNQSQLGQTPLYMSECPILLKPGVSESVVNSRLATLKQNLVDAEGEAVAGASQLAQSLELSMNKIGVVQRCEVPRVMLNFQLTVSHLDKVMKKHISNVDCDEAPISSTHGPWLSKMKKFKSESVASIDPMELLNSIDVYSAVGALLLLLFNLSPVLLVRTTQTSASKGPTETEI